MTVLPCSYALETYTIKPLLTGSSGLLISVGRRWFWPIRISIILLFYTYCNPRENSIFEKIILDKNLTIFLWLVSKPQLSYLSLPNNGITASYYCIQLEDNLKDMAYQDENLVANCYSIPAEEAWQFNVLFKKRGGYFRCFQLPLRKPRRLAPFLFSVLR